MLIRLRFLGIGLNQVNGHTLYVRKFNMKPARISIIS